MSLAPPPAEFAAVPPNPGRQRLRRERAKTSLLSRGEPLVWMTGGALAMALVMILGMLGYIVVQGLTNFWPKPVFQIVTRQGQTLLGELSESEAFRPSPQDLSSLPPDSAARQSIAAADGWSRRTRLQVGRSCVWVNDFDVRRVDTPEWGLVIERTSGGRTYGVLSEYRDGQGQTNRQPQTAWDTFRAQFTGPVEAEFGQADPTPAQARQAGPALVVMADGRPQEIPLATIVRAYPANQLGFGSRWSVYQSRWWEFLTAPPREANSEGGVLPAIVGTLTMTILMSAAVVPFGVLAALYLREYARPGLAVSMVRIAVNNLAGVPSIVFGVFGLGFFCYTVGANIDELFYADRLPAQPTFGKGGLLWASLTLALLTLPVVIVATEEALAAVPSSMREGSYACGASKWQTIRRIVLPRAMPGVMTGLILAMARGAGEVAPLMLVGVTNLAFELPVDGAFPFVHPERKFMHLAFHIYDLGYQSPYSDTARPLVFSTTLLLLLMIATLNLSAIWLRARLRKRYILSQF